MSVRKYRSVEEMEDTFWISPGTPAHRRAIRQVLENMAFFTQRIELPQGVYKFRTVEEASRQREEWER